MPNEDKPNLAAKAQEIDAQPVPSDKNLRPGTVVGDGYATEMVPFTIEWYLDIEARRKEPEFGPEYQLHEVIPSQTMPVRVNGVGFMLYAGRRCKLPTPHYQVYVNYLKNFQDLDQQYAIPDGGPKPMQVHRIEGPWTKTGTTS